MSSQVSVYALSTPSQYPVISILGANGEAISNPISSTNIPQKFQSGLYYIPTGSFTIGASNSHTLNRLFLMPMELWNAVSFDQWGIGITVAGSAGSLLRCGFYPDANGGPDITADPYEEKTIATDATGSRTVAFTAPRSLQGRVWLSYVFQVAVPTSRSFSAGATSFCGSVSANDLNFARYKDGVSGALPAPLGALTGGIGLAPAITLRAT